LAKDKYKLEKGKLQVDRRQLCVDKRTLVDKAYTSRAYGKG